MKGPIIWNSAQSRIIPVGKEGGHRRDEGESLEGRNSETSSMKEKGRARRSTGGSVESAVEPLTPANGEPSSSVPAVAGAAGAGPGAASQSSSMLTSGAAPVMASHLPNGRDLHPAKDLDDPSQQQPHHLPNGTSPDAHPTPEPTSSTIPGTDIPVRHRPSEGGNQTSERPSAASSIRGHTWSIRSEGSDASNRNEAVAAGWVPVRHACSLS